MAKLTASNGPACVEFGSSVGISGDRAIVGAPNLPGYEDSPGSAYLYERDESGPDNWGEITKITASDGALGDEFGESVAISGDTVIVGAVEKHNGLASRASAH